VAECGANFKTLRGLQERLAEAEVALAVQSITPGLADCASCRASWKEFQPIIWASLPPHSQNPKRRLRYWPPPEGGHLLFAQHCSGGTDMNALLKEVLEKVGGKGGGTRDFARGRLNDAAQAGRALSLAKEMLRLARSWAIKFAQAND